MITRSFEVKFVLLQKGQARPNDLGLVIKTPGGDEGEQSLAQNSELSLCSCRTTTSVLNSYQHKRLIRFLYGSMHRAGEIQSVSSSGSSTLDSMIRRTSRRPSKTRSIEM